MAVKQRLFPFERLEKASSTMTYPALQVVNKTFSGSTASDYPGPIYLLRLVNDTDQQVGISFDGSTRVDHLPSGDSMQIYAPIIKGEPAPFPKTTRIWVAGNAGSGNFYVCAYGLENP